VAHAAGVDANADVAGAGLGEFFCYELERTAGGGYLHGTAFDWWHGEALLRLGWEANVEVAKD
jgi:hypothetical protein